MLCEMYTIYYYVIYNIYRNDNRWSYIHMYMFTYIYTYIIWLHLLLYCPVLPTTWHNIYLIAFHGVAKLIIITTKYNTVNTCILSVHIINIIADLQDYIESYGGNTLNAAEMYLDIRIHDTRHYPRQEPSIYAARLKFNNE